MISHRIVTELIDVLENLIGVLEFILNILQLQHISFNQISSPHSLFSYTKRKSRSILGRPA